jgi:hypothetical protein
MTEVTPEFKWNLWPAPTPLHTVECDMILPFGRIYCCKLNGADFLPPIIDGYKQRTRDEVEKEMWQKFLRFIGAA